MGRQSRQCFSPDGWRRRLSQNLMALAAGAATSSDPVAAAVGSWVNCCCSVVEEEEVDAGAAIPNLAQAFFHLHCVHQRSLCSSPYTFLHFFPSRGLLEGDLVEAEAPEGEEGEWAEEEEVEDGESGEGEPDGRDGGLIRISLLGEPCRLHKKTHEKGRLLYKKMYLALTVAE